MTKLKILFENFAYKPAYTFGGPTHSVPALAEALVARGHQVTVYTSNAESQEKNLGVPVNEPTVVDGVKVWYFHRENVLKKYFHWFPYLSKSVGLFYCPLLSKKIRESITQFDIVHTHCPFTYTHWRVSHAAMQFNKPLFYHQRGVLSPDLLNYRKLKKLLTITFLEKPIMKKSKTLIALNKNEEEYYKKLKIKTPIEIIPNGIDNKKIESHKSGNFACEIGIGEGDILLLFMARLNWKKGANTLLSAFRKTAPRIPEARLVFAGFDEGDMRSDLEKKNA